MIDLDKYQHEIKAMTDAWKMLLQEINSGADRHAAINRFLDEEDGIERRVDEVLSTSEHLKSDKHPDLADEMGAVMVLAQITYLAEMTAKTDLPEQMALIELLLPEIEKQHDERFAREIDASDAEAKRLLEQLGIFPKKGGKEK